MNKTMQTPPETLLNPAGTPCRAGLSIKQDQMIRFHLKQRG